MTEGARRVVVRLGPPLACALLLLVALLATTGDLGYTRDEGFYFTAARAYEGWFRLLADDRHAALSRAAVDRAWGVNHEHPPLMKSLFALGHAELGRGVFAQAGTAFRFPSMLVSALMAGLVCAWGARRHGALAGVVAALSLAFMPRVFFHAHLACFDAPITAVMLLCFWAWDRALAAPSPLRVAGVGIAFGLGLLTKHNAWFLPFAFAAHGLARAAITWRTGGRPLVASAGAAKSLLAMALIGPLMLFALWPWLWFDGWHRLVDYVRFHTGHEFYNMEFLGTNYFEPPMPRGYAPVMIVATVPTVTLAAAAVGAGTVLASVARGLRDRDAALVAEGSTPLLWLIGAGVSLAPWLSTSTPIFGGTKHWMPAYPFVALLAGEGFACSARALSAWAVPRARLARAVAPLVALSLLLPPITQALHAHPWALSSYTPLVGGARGGADLGLNRTFWGYTSGSLCDYLNQTLPHGGRVYPHDTAAPSWDMLVADGRLRRDIQAVWRAEDADVVLYQQELHMQGQEYQAWVLFGTTRPDVVAGPDGVPVIWAYTNPDSRRVLRSAAQKE